MFAIMNVTKALADENRVRMLAALEGGELCVCQLTELMQLAPSTVSKHLSVLRGARLIESRKEGRWIYYRLSQKDAPELVTQALSWLTEAVRSQQRIEDDRQRLEEILKTDPEQLCRKQAQGSDETNGEMATEVLVFTHT